MRWLVLILILSLCIIILGGSTTQTASCLEILPSCYSRGTEVQGGQCLLSQQQELQLQLAKVRCGFIYPNSPCIKEFRVNLDNGHIGVICGGEEE
jgi:hypothetical protein